MDEPSDIRNWRRRPDGITTSGKLDQSDVARLAACGVRHVINLALDDHPEALAEEARLVRHNGMRYTHIPVPFDAPAREHVEQLSQILKEGDGPFHVHCIMNYRVTAFFYLLDLKAGTDEAEAKRRMTSVWDPLESEDPRAQPWKDLLSS